MIGLVISLLLLGIFSLTSPAQGLELYQWEDAQGHIHIVDAPEKIPPQYRHKASRLEFTSPPPKPAPPPAEKKKNKLEPKEQTDAYGRTLSWYLEQKRLWLKKVEELTKQIEENQRVMRLLHRGVPQARRGTRTKYGLKLGQGPLLRRWAEYKRLQKINKELEQMRQKAQYMANQGILRQAARAGAPAEWLEVIRKDP